jgi:hypothetical protein
MSSAYQLEMTLPGDFRGVLGVTVRLMSDGELRRLEAPGLPAKGRAPRNGAAVVPA